jgi:hypothetical protein
MVFLAAVVLIGIPLCRNRTGKAIYCSIAGVALFVFAAIRKYTGYDYNLYGQIFLDYLKMSMDDIGEHRFEKGIAIPMKILGDMFYIDYQTMFYVYAFLFALMLMLLLWKTSDRPYLGVFFFMTLGLYFNSLNFMRQMLAAFIIVLGMRYIKTNQFFRYLIVVIFASCFHLSALVMIPFYFILKIKLTPVVLGIYAGGGLIVFIFSWQIIQFLTKTFLPKYYTPGEMPQTGEMSGTRFPIYTVFFALCLIFCFLFRKKLQEKDPFNNVWLGCMIFAFYFDLISMKHNIVGRLAIPFLVASAAVLLPRAFECMLEWCKEKFRKDRKQATISSAVAAASVAIICVGMYGYMIGNNYNGVNPYQTIFGNAVWEVPEK